MEITLSKIANDPTLKEVLAGTIGKLRTLTLNELLKTEDEVKKQELDERQRILYYESIAVLGEGDEARSIQDKALRFYSPILKAHYDQR